MALSETDVNIIRNKIREYEHEFKAQEGRKPNKDEIKQNAKMLKYYKLYWKIKDNPASVSLSSLVKAKPIEESPKEEPKVEPKSVTPSRLWGSSLNKTPKVAAKTGDKDLDRFYSLGTKLRGNEERYIEQAQSNKSLNYSLRFKRKQLLEKSIEATEALRIKRLNEESQKKNKADEHLYLTYNDESCTLPSSTEPEPTLPFTELAPECHFELDFPVTVFKQPAPVTPVKLPVFPVSQTSKPESSPQSAFSLLQSLANGNAPIPTTTIEPVSGFDDFGGDFHLDSVNDFIKNSIISDETFIESGRKSRGPVKAQKRLFDLEDEGLFTVQKRHRPGASNIEAGHSGDALDGDTTNKPRKFFKGSGPNDRATYGTNNFLDADELDFPLSDDNDGDSEYIPDHETGSKSKKLANVTNQKDLPSAQSKPAKAKAPAKKVKENYRRLQMKKKSFMSKGYKKFNMKQYKYKSWQKNKNYKKNDNKCFKCGDPNHWANACPSNSSQKTSVDDGSLAQSDATFDANQTYDICLNEPLFTDLDDPELDQLVEESLTAFGFESFRPNQKLTVKRILCSQSTLLVSPTGWGKSLCYQLAAYCFWQKKRLITLVVSPLISLMQDQIFNFPSVLKPVAINSSMDEKAKGEAVNSIIEGRAQVLFLSPECIVGGLHFINFDAFARVAFVCIDEAHCLAEWSTNFRPSYLHLYKVLRYKLNIKTILAMTATVTQETTRIICKNLNLQPEVDVVGSTKVPENLVLTISSNTDKLKALITLLQSEPFKSLKSIIIYCTKRDQTASLETQIRTLMQFDVPQSKLNSLVRAYHAGLSSYERTHIQTQFISGKLRIVVATIAFGMGINKADIRGIIHYNMPKSFENYIQEIGRAGRDGQTAYCHLFLDKQGEDLFGLQNFIYANGVDKPSLRRLLGKIYQPCKCNLLATIEEDSGISGDSSLDQPPRPVNDHSICKGHPGALPITSTEIEIDLKSESIYTLLMALEQNYPQAPIQVQSPGYSTAVIVNFGEEADMYELVKQSPIVQMGATLTKQECKEKFDFSNFKFSIAKVASMLGMEVGQVKSELRRLEWLTDPITKRRKKSHVGIRFEDHSYMFRAPGTLSESQIEEIVVFLWETIEQYEAKEIYKLRFVYSKFSEFILDHREGQAAVTLMSDRLKHFINAYFAPSGPSPMPSDLDSSKLILPLSFELANQDTASISLAICELLHYHYSEGVNSSRKMARILQGIGSPKFPPEVWGKVRRFWRSQQMIDFKDLMVLCQEGLIRSYSSKSN